MKALGRLSDRKTTKLKHIYAFNLHTRANIVDCLRISEYVFSKAGM